MVLKQRKIMTSENHQRDRDGRRTSALAALWTAPTVAAPARPTLLRLAMGSERVAALWPPPAPPPTPPRRSVAGDEQADAANDDDDDEDDEST